MQSLLSWVSRRYEPLAWRQRVKTDRRIVFQRRDKGIRVYPDLLTFFGGKIEDGEGPREAALRELREETSISVDENSQNYQRIGTLHVPLSHISLVEVHLFEVAIDSPDIEIYEGQRAETYSKADALARVDLAELTVKLLANVAD